MLPKEEKKNTRTSLQSQQDVELSSERRRAPVFRSPVVYAANIVSVQFSLGHAVGLSVGDRQEIESTPGGGRPLPGGTATRLRIGPLPTVLGLRLLLALVALRLALLQLDPVGGAVRCERVDLVLALMHLVKG